MLAIHGAEREGPTEPGQWGLGNEEGHCGGGEMAAGLEG